MTPNKLQCGQEIDNGSIVKTHTYEVKKQILDLMDLNGYKPCVKIFIINRSSFPFALMKIRLGNYGDYCVQNRIVMFSFQIGL